MKILHPDACDCGNPEHRLLIACIGLDYALYRAEGGKKKKSEYRASVKRLIARYRRVAA